MPFSWTIPKELNGFISPHTVRFTLTPFMSAKRFTCNLRAGDEYLFHFRVDFRQSSDKYSKVCIFYSNVWLYCPRIVQDAVIRNSTRKMKWLTEEREISRFPFSKGITCDILFIAYGSTVAVSQLKQLFCWGSKDGLKSILLKAPF